MIVRRRAIAKRPEPAQKIELLLAEPGDIDEGLRPGQHRQQTQQQHLVERINHLAALPRIRQILEIVQKNNGFAERPTIPPQPSSIAVLRNRIRGSRQIQHFSPLSPLLHPIALSREGDRVV